MNREIKFRQYSNGHMHYGGASDGTWVGFPYVSWDKYPLMQYTGLKDKNGVEIYEGDIIEVGMTLWEVMWYHSDAAYRLHHKTKGGMGLAGVNNLFAVIGNIYENREDEHEPSD